MSVADELVQAVWFAVACGFVLGAVLGAPAVSWLYSIYDEWAYRRQFTVRVGS